MTQRLAPGVFAPRHDHDPCECVASLPRAFAALLCLLAALCLIPIGLSARRDLFTTDTRACLAARLHRWAVRLAFVSIVGAIFCYATSVTLRRLLQILFVLGAVALAALLSVVLSKPGPYHGALQKTLVMAIVLWIWLFSFTEGTA